MRSTESSRIVDGRIARVVEDRRRVKNGWMLLAAGLVVPTDVGDLFELAFENADFEQWLGQSFGSLVSFVGKVVFLGQKIEDLRLVLREEDQVFADARVAERGLYTTRSGSELDRALREVADDLAAEPTTLRMRVEAMPPVEIDTGRLSHNELLSLTYSRYEAEPKAWQTIRIDETDEWYTVAAKAGEFVASGVADVTLWILEMAAREWSLLVDTDVVRGGDTVLPKGFDVISLTSTRGELGPTHVRTELRYLGSKSVLHSFAPSVPARSPLYVVIPSTDVLLGAKIEVHEPRGHLRDRAHRAWPELSTVRPAARRGAARARRLRARRRARGDRLARPVDRGAPRS